MRSPRWIVGVLGPTLVAYALITSPTACSNIDTTLAPPTAINIGVTAISVDPMDFLGGVTCSGIDGGMGSYVATITDVTNPEMPFTLPSSPPTPCSQLTYFQNVNQGDLYVAEIDGYTQDATQLVPLCGALPPGAVQRCTADSQCNPAYGCQGTCKVTTYEDLSAECVAGCAPDAGSAKMIACASACAYQPGAGVIPTEASALAGFQSCLTACGFDIVNGCLNAANNYCLSTEFAALQNDCPTEPIEAAPDGGVLRGAVKACSCVYVPTEGSRQMFLASDSTATSPVPPPWTTTCAEGAPVESSQFADVPVQPCVPLAGSLTGTTTIALIPDSTLGELSCGAAESGITSFDVVPSPTPGAPPLTTYTGLPCPSGNGVTFTNAIPETNYTFTVYGYQGSSTPTQSADCVAFPIFGSVTTAQCDPLVPITDAGADGG